MIGVTEVEAGEHQRFTFHNAWATITIDAIGEVTMTTIESATQNTLGKAQMAAQQASSARKTSESVAQQRRAAVERQEEEQAAQQQAQTNQTRATFSPRAQELAAHRADSDHDQEQEQAAVQQISQINAQLRHTYGSQD